MSRASVDHRYVDQMWVDLAAWLAAVERDWAPTVRGIRLAERLAASLHHARSSHWVDTATVEDLRNFQLHLVDTGTSAVTLNATLTGLSSSSTSPWAAALRVEQGNGVISKPLPKSP